MITLDCNFKKLDGGGTDWIDLAHGRGRKCAFMDTVMNPKFHKVQGIF
jgi:hypothetical protein